MSYVDCFLDMTTTFNLCLTDEKKKEKTYGWLLPTEVQYSD